MKIYSDRYSFGKCLMTGWEFEVLNEMKNDRDRTAQNYPLTSETSSLNPKKTLTFFDVSGQFFCGEYQNIPRNLSDLYVIVRGFMDFGEHLSITSLLLYQSSELVSLVSELVSLVINNLFTSELLNFATSVIEVTTEVMEVTTGDDRPSP